MATKGESDKKSLRTFASSKGRTGGHGLRASTERSQSVFTPVLGICPTASIETSEFFYILFNIFNFSFLMINYSLSPRAVDPSKQDGEKRYYPNAQTAKNMQLDEFANHISKHNCPYHRSDIGAVLTRSVDCLREMLLEGNKVCLGDLGNFYVRLESKGAVSVEKFNPSTDILSVKVYWEPGPLFRDLIKDAEFVNVATRRAQDATLRAERAGMTTVDISKATGSGDGGAGNGSEDGSGTGGSGNTGTGSEDIPPVLGGDDEGGSSGGGSSDGSDDIIIDEGGV